MYRNSSALLVYAAALALAACGATEADSAPSATESRAPAAARTAVPAPAASAEAVAAPASAAAAPASRARSAREAPAPTPAAVSRSEPASHDAAPAADPPVPAAAAPAAAPSDADAILRRASAAYDRVRSLEASFSQTLTVPLLDQTQHGHGKLYIRRPDHLLMKFSQPAGDVIDVDGKYAWIYYPSSDPKQVIRTDVANGAAQVDFQKQFLTNPTARFDATVTGTATVDGRSAWALTLVPKGESSYKRIRVWVDKRDALVRRFEITQENDSVRRIELSGLKINPTLPDSLFRFTPPPGAEIFQQ